MKTKRTFGKFSLTFLCRLNKNDHPFRGSNRPRKERFSLILALLHSVEKDQVTTLYPPLPKPGERGSGGEGWPKFRTLS